METVKWFGISETMAVDRGQKGHCALLRGSDCLMATKQQIYSEWVPPVYRSPHSQLFADTVIALIWSAAAAEGDAEVRQRKRSRYVKEIRKFSSESASQIFGLRFGLIPTLSRLMLTKASYQL